MKKYISLLISVLLIVSLCACTEKYVHVDTSSDVSAVSSEETSHTNESVTESTATENSSAMVNSVQAQSSQSTSSSTSVVASSQQQTGTDEQQVSSKVESTSSTTSSKEPGSLDADDHKNYFVHNPK